MAASSNENLEATGRFRLDGVDAIRGLAVVMVVMHHIHLRFWLNDYPVDGVLPKPVNQLMFWSGYYAVIAFSLSPAFSLPISRSAVGDHPEAFGWRTSTVCASQELCLA